MRGRAAAALLALVTPLVATAPASAGWTAARAIPQAKSSFPFPVGVGVNDSGTAAVVWRSRGDFPQRARVRVTVRRPRAPGSPPRTLSPPGVAGTTVAVDGRGRVLVAWVQQPHNAIRLATRRPGGRWRTVTLGRSGHFVEAAPRIAVNDRGDAVVVWRGLRRIAGETTEATVAAYRPAGRAFEPARPIPDEGLGVRAQPQVALNAGGRAYAVWTARVDATQVLFSERGRTGAWSPALALGTPPASAPVVAAGDRGDVAVAWRQADLDSEGNGVQAGDVAVTARPAGGAFLPPRVYAASARPLLAVARDGAALVAWMPPIADGPYAPEVRFAAGRAGTGFGDEQTLPEAAVGAVAAVDGAMLLASADVGGVIVRDLGGPSLRLARVGSTPLLASAGDRAVLVYFRGNRLYFSVRTGS